MSSAHVRATIGGDTTEYRRALSGMEGMTQSSARNLTRIFAGIGIGAILQRWGRAVIRWGSDASIAARNAQIMTSEMIALNRIGIQSGMRGSADFARMIARVSDELARAARGSEESARKFEQMGLSVGDLIRLDPAQQLQAIAKAAFDSGLPIANLSDLFGQRLGPTAMVALREIAQNGLPEVDDAIGDTADMVEALGSKWAETMDQMKAKTAQWANSLHNAVSDAAAFWGGVYGAQGSLADRFREGSRQMQIEEENREKSASIRRERRVLEQRQSIEELIRLYESAPGATAPGVTARGPMTPGAGMDTDALRRIGGMTDTGASAVREQTQLDRTRNTMLSRIEASTRAMAQRRDQSANFAMR